MKLSPHSHKTYWDFHAWGGVILGLIGFVMFTVGSVIVFRDAIATWQDPMAQKASPDASLEHQVDLAGAEMADRKVTDFALIFPHDGEGLLRTGYFDPASSSYTESWVDADKDRLVPKRDKSATLLYHIHTLYSPSAGWAYYIYLAAGFISAILVMILVTGVLIHLRNIVQQFHQYRPEARPLVKWNDMHKVLGVMSVPFQLLFAYSAVIIVLGPMFVGGIAGPIFDGEQGETRQELTGAIARPGHEAGEAAEMIPADEIVATARQKRPGLKLDQLRFRHYGHEGAYVDVRGTLPDEHFSRTIVRVDPESGSVMAVSGPDTRSSSATLRRALIDLHIVGLGGMGLHIVAVLLGLASAASMLTGIGIWLARRRRRRDSLADRLLEKATAGVGTATIIGIAWIFLGSRLIPWTMEGRWWAQEWTFYVVWLGGVLSAFLATELRALWRRRLIISGVLFAAAPFAALRHSSAGLFGWLTDAQAELHPHVVGVDIGLILAAIACVASALLLPSADTEAE